jgi:hypothetical protein
MGHAHAMLKTPFLRAVVTERDIYHMVIKRSAKIVFIALRLLTR